MSLLARVLYSAHLFLEALSWRLPFVRRSQGVWLRLMVWSYALGGAARWRGHDQRWHVRNMPKRVRWLTRVASFALVGVAAALLLGLGAKKKGA